VATQPRHLYRLLAFLDELLSRAALAPHETDSPLIVDSDAVLALAAAPRNSQRKTAGDARTRVSRCFIPNTQAPRG
jgi:hypothetical protein